ncbi:MAG: complex I subunit 1 family protein [Aquificota bacterium]|jgi:ech hydrogenase subunit B
MKTLLLVLAILAPLLGGIIYGLERKVKARMQNRMGPPILQPFYDFFKLADKRPLQVHSFHSLMGIAFFFAAWFAVFSLMVGPNLLVAIFLHVLALLFITAGGFSVKSPYSVMGALRELAHILAAEPILVFAVVGLYLASGSWNVIDILHSEPPPLLKMPLVFAVLLLTLPILLKKSPFDISEAHQEIIGGWEIEYSGIYYEAVYTAKWLEYVFVYFIIFLFGGANYLLGLGLVLLAFLFVALIDNSTTRLTIHHMVKFSLGVLLPLAAFNVFWVALWGH